MVHGHPAGVAQEGRCEDSPDLGKGELLGGISSSITYLIAAPDGCLSWCAYAWPAKVLHAVYMQDLGPVQNRALHTCLPELR